MNYNGIPFDSNRLCLQFINGLGNYFTQLRIISTIPSEWQTIDITLINHTARTYLFTLETNYEMNRSQSAYLKAALAEIPPENSPGCPHQHPRQQTTGTPNLPPPTPTQPSPLIPTPTPRTPRMVNGRVEKRTDDQRGIMKEIGYHQHTPERIAFFQSETGSVKCYYHFIDHASSTYYAFYTEAHRVATDSPSSDSAQRPQRPPLQGNLVGGAATMARHISDSQVGCQLVKNPDPSPPPSTPTPPVDDITPTARQVIHE